MQDLLAGRPDGPTDITVTLGTLAGHFMLTYTHGEHWERAIQLVDLLL